MYRKLLYKTADCVTEVFSVSSSKVIPQTAKKNQVVHDMDDGSLSVISLSSKNFFNIELQWTYLPSDDHTTIMDFWHDVKKGDGKANTFYWLHPIDGYTYTVRFIGELTTVYNPIGQKAVNVLPLRVEGLATPGWFTDMTDYWTMDMTDFWDTNMSDIWLYESDDDTYWFTDMTDYWTMDMTDFWDTNMSDHKTNIIGLEA